MAQQTNILSLFGSGGTGSLDFYGFGGGGKGGGGVPGAKTLDASNYDYFSGSGFDLGAFDMSGMMDSFIVEANANITESFQGQIDQIDKEIAKIDEKLVGAEEDLADAKADLAVFDMGDLEAAKKKKDDARAEYQAAQDAVDNYDPDEDGIYWDPSGAGSHGGGASLATLERREREAQQKYETANAEYAVLNGEYEGLKAKVDAAETIVDELKSSREELVEERGFLAEKVETGFFNASASALPPEMQEQIDLLTASLGFSFN